MPSVLPLRDVRTTAVRLLSSSEKSVQRNDLDMNSPADEVVR
jgi:hypothetical protein